MTALADNHPYQRKEVIGDATLYLGDCLEVMPTLGKVDAVVTDPPYFLPAQHYQTRKQFTRNFSDLGILEHFFKSFFRVIDKILSMDGSLYMFCDGQSYPLFYYHAFPLFKSVKPIIWDKLISINGYGWRHQHEIIIWGARPESRPIPTGDGDIIKLRAVPVAKRKHPAEKPLLLIEKILEKTGQVILDPFMGSGTTGVACVNLGCGFIGIETNENYFNTAFDRIVQTGLKPKAEQLVL